MLQLVRVVVRQLGGPIAALTISAVVLLLIVGVWIAVTLFRAEHHLRAALADLDRDRIETARLHIEQSLRLRPSSAEIHLVAGRIARGAGKTAEARRFLRRSRELGWPDEAVTFEELLLAAQSDPRPYAGYLFARLQGASDQGNLILEALSRGYLTVFDLPRARYCLDAWVKHNPEAIRARLWRGDVEERLGRHDRAREDFERVVDLDPEHVEARTRLAQILLRSQRLDEAAAHLEIAQRQQPDNVEVLRGLARCRQEQNRREDAARLLQRAVDLAPDDVLTLTQRGLLALEASDLEEAEKALRQAVTLAPFEREPLFNFSRCLQAVGKAEEARKWEERLARVEADLKLVKQLMARVLASPADPTPRHELGVIFLRNHQDREGIRWLQSALQYDPGHRPTHAALADVFEKQGETENALRHRQLAQ